MIKTPDAPSFDTTWTFSPRSMDDIVEVTVILRHKPGNRRTPAAWLHAPRPDQAVEACRADAADADAVHAFARDHALDVVLDEPWRRTIRLRGSIQKLQEAFGVELGYFTSPDSAQVAGCRGEPRVPASLQSRVIAVLGMDQRPVAMPRFRRPQAQPAATYTPVQLGEAYAFPAHTDGGGQTVAIIELGGGYDQQDLTTYFQKLGLQSPDVSVVSVDGGSNTPGSSADGEVMLDIEVVGALAPAARIVVYFAPNTDQGFHDAVSQAAHDSSNAPSIISISWGGPEDSWSNQARTAMNAALEDAATLGVTVTAACGDNGSGDGVSDGQPHVDFPSSSPYALACGGTRLETAGGTPSSEVVWNELAAGDGATGGGVSNTFALPAYQQQSGVPAAPNGSKGRGVPDVSGNADPLTGYQVRVDGRDEVIGGTSAVAPLWAALIARLNQALGQHIGNPHAAFYQAAPAVFRDITSGNNGDYSARAGWDACTGLGSPDGTALLKALDGTAGKSQGPR